MIIYHLQGFENTFQTNVFLKTSEKLYFCDILGGIEMDIKMDKMDIKANINIVVKQMKRLNVSITHKLF